MYTTYMIQDILTTDFALTRTSFRSTQAESGHFGILQRHSPRYAATFAWQRSTLHAEGYQRTAQRLGVKFHTLHAWDEIAGRFEPVSYEPLTPKDGGFGDGRQLEVIVWAGEVQET